MKKATKISLISALATLVAIPILALAVLRFGCLHWHKAIYMFRVYRWPSVHYERYSGGARYAFPPHGFDGTWRTYGPDGTLRHEWNYRAGEKHGSCLYWHANGVKSHVRYYNNGRSIGTWIWWDENGNVVKEELQGGRKPLRPQDAEQADER